MKKLFEKDDFQRRDEIQKTKKELEKLELRKTNLQNDLMDRSITSHDYQDMKSRVDKDIVLTKEKLTELQQEKSPFKVYLQKEVPMLENLLEYYRKADGGTKKKILGTIFAEKLVLEKGKVSAPVFTESIQLILLISEVLRRSEKKNDVDFSQLLVATLEKNRFSKFKSCSPPLKKIHTSHPLN
ncbi:MAG: hypothetical protein RBR81_13820 [Bacteroidales bacterium]|nr:hypothetical protein [Bacteroidales bacterium]